MDKQLIYKYLFVTLGGMIAMLQDISMLVVVSTFAILLDFFSAIRLSRRVKKAGRGNGKVTSEKGKKILSTMATIYPLIVFAYLLDLYVVTMVDLYLENIVAGIFCFWNFWSILENESSANDARWAKVLQKILIDKAERHFDVDLTEFKEKEGTK